jgi:hypothetical protein
MAALGFRKGRGEDHPLVTIRFISAKTRLQGVGVGILFRCLKAVLAIRHVKSPSDTWPTLINVVFCVRPRGQSHALPPDQEFTSVIRNHRPACRSCAVEALWKP